MPAPVRLATIPSTASAIPCSAASTTQAIRCVTPRPCWTVASTPRPHWDGEFDRIEDLVTARIGLPSESGGGYGGRGRSPISPGHSTLTPEDPELTALTQSGRLALELGKLPRAQDLVEEAGRYRELFVIGFGTMEVSRARIAEAIGEYCRSIESTPAPYDAYVAGNPRALSDAAVRGLALFEGKAGCAQCHLTDVAKAKKRLTDSFSRRELNAMTRAPFKDFEFHNTGVAWLRKKDNEAAAAKAGVALPPGVPPGVKIPGSGRAAKLARLVLALHGVEDAGRMRISTANRDMRAFKTPTLRDLTRRGPYMHDGRYATLEAVVRHYALGDVATKRGGSAHEDPHRDSLLKPFDITDDEVADLVAFLESLTGEQRPGLAPHRFALRAKKTRLQFLDDAGKPLAKLTLKLIPVGDRLPQERVLRSDAQVLTTNAKGVVQYTPGATTHMRIQLPHHVQPVSGALVPDTCEETKVVVPVNGRIRFVLTVEEGAVAPATLRLEHQGTFVLPGHAAPSTRLDLVRGPASGAAGLAIYEGWRRTDVPSTVRCPLPDGSRTAHDVSKPTSLRSTLRK